LRKQVSLGHLPIVFQQVRSTGKSSNSGIAHDDKEANAAIIVLRVGKDNHKNDCSDSKPIEEVDNRDSHRGVNDRREILSNKNSETNRSREISKNNIHEFDVDQNGDPVEYCQDEGVVRRHHYRSVL